MLGRPLLRVSGLLLARARSSAEDDLALELRAGEALGLVGDAARGDALFATLAAAAGGDTPEVRRLAPGASLGVLSTEVPPRSDLSVWAALQEPLRPLRGLMERLEELVLDLEGREEEFERLDALAQWHEAGSLPGHVLRVLSVLELQPEARLADLDAAARRRLALAALLLRAPDVLVLDDPARGLSAPHVDWLRRRLARYPGALLLRAPDRAFARWIVRDLLDLGPPAVRRPCWDVTGEVVDDGGRPLADLVVTAVGTTGEPRPSCSACTNPRGEFALPVGGPGPFRLEVHASPPDGGATRLGPVPGFRPVAGGARGVRVLLRGDAPGAGAPVPAR